MSKTQKDKSQKEKTGFLCFVYGGCMKLGYVRYFPSEHSPEEEFEKFKSHYGSDVKGRFIKVPNPSDAYSKVRAELTKTNIPNPFGDIYELGVITAGKVMKEVNGVKKASTWGQGEKEEAGGDEEEGGDKQADKSADKSASSSADKSADKSVSTADKSASTADKKSKSKVVAKGGKKKTEAQEIDAEEGEDEVQGGGDGKEPSDVEPEKAASKSSKKSKSDKSDKVEAAGGKADEQAKPESSDAQKADKPSKKAAVPKTKQ